MTVLTRKKEAVLDRLIQLGGSAALVELALRDLSVELAAPPTLEAIVRRILEYRAANHRESQELSRRLREEKITG